MPIHFEVSVVFADDFPGYYAKGESVDFDGMALLRLKDGVIVEDTSYGRDPKMLQFLLSEV